MLVVADNCDDKTTVIARECRAEAVERFEARVGWTKQMLEDEASAWCTELGWKTKHAFMLLRVAVTGRTATPPLFETMAALGKEITRRRLRRAAEAIAKAKPPEAVAKAK